MPRFVFSDRSLLDEDLLCALRDEAEDLNSDATRKDAIDIITGKEACGKSELSKPKSAEWFVALVQAVERQLLYGSSDEWASTSSKVLKPRTTPKGIALHTANIAKDVSSAEINILILKECFELITYAIVLDPSPIEATIHALNAGVVQLCGRACDDYLMEARSRYDGDKGPVDQSWFFDQSNGHGCLYIIATIKHSASCTSPGCRIPFDKRVVDLAKKQMRTVNDLLRSRMQIHRSSGYMSTLSLGGRISPQQQYSATVLMLWSTAEQEIGMHPAAPPIDRRVEWLYDCSWKGCRHRPPKLDFDPSWMLKYDAKPLSRRCGRCKTSKYCSDECQVADWKSGHKSKCIATSS